ncbi:hypothetical protein WA026_002065 [Henosepilachna vigintioctopunctata]|uniref:Uncharacterized protein n=1 Tax=Henosepilachna vigintioctopunctata TaxID=420089 RepID=A0AAW1TZ82_9CUCU
MSSEKIAVVTGSNKGIGFGIVKGLCERFNGKVYLTARDLDINDQESINKFKDHIVKEYGGIDILVNNAAIAFKHNSPEPFGKQAEETIAVNYFSLLKICNTLFPILRENARVVNLSSSEGHLSKIPSQDLRKKFSDASLNVENLSKLMEKFVNDAKAGKNVAEGWGKSSYAVSKVGCSSLTFIQQKEFDNEKPYRNISANCVHPGYVDTDMTSHKGPLTIDEGAVGPLYLSLDDHGLKGKYVWYDKRVVDWYGDFPN